jgi:hypothetical protein
MMKHCSSEWTPKQIAERKASNMLVRVHLLAALASVEEAAMHAFPRDREELLNDVMVDLRKLADKYGRSNQ